MASSLNTNQAKSSTAALAPLQQLTARPFGETETETEDQGTADLQTQLSHAALFGHGLSTPQPIQRQSETGTDLDEEEETSIQAKLTIGQPNDKYEQEADQIAAKVMRMPELAEGTGEQGGREALVQREASHDEDELAQAKLQRQPVKDEQEDDTVQAKSGGIQSKGGAPAIPENFESQLGQHKGGGRPLSDETRAYMEPRFGADFSNVRVHEAPTLASDIQAQAFTHGQDVYFNSGKYNPGSSSGKELLAHELTHTIQQSSSPIQSKLISTKQAIPNTEKSPEITTKENIDSPEMAGEIDAQSSVVTELPLQNFQKDNSTESTSPENISSESKLSGYKEDATKAEGDHIESAEVNEIELESVASGDKGNTERNTENAEPREIEVEENKSKQAEHSETEAAASRKNVTPEEVISGANQIPEGVDISALSSVGDTDLVNFELAEHERWAGSFGEIGTAGSDQRAQFLLDQAGQGATSGAIGGAGMGFVMGAIGAGVGQVVGRRLATLAVSRGLSATPVPGLGPAIGGVMAVAGLAMRDWGATADAISKVGTGEGYEGLANDLEGVAEALDVATQVMDVLGGVLGAISVGMWVGAVLSAGTLSPLATTLSAIATGITIATTAVGIIISAAVRPTVTALRALHTFESQGDPAQIEAEGQQLQAAAGQITGAVAGAAAGKVGGRAGARGGDSTDNAVRNFQARRTGGSPDMSAAAGPSPRLHVEVPKAPRQVADNAPARPPAVDESGTTPAAIPRPAETDGPMARSSGRRTREADLRRQHREDYIERFQEAEQAGGVHHSRSTLDLAEDLHRHQRDRLVELTEEGRSDTGGYQERLEYSHEPRRADMPSDPDPGESSRLRERCEHIRGVHGRQTRKPLEQGEMRDPHWDVTEEPSIGGRGEPADYVSSLDRDFRSQTEGFEDTYGWQTRSREPGMRHPTTKPGLSLPRDKRAEFDAAWEQFQSTIEGNSGGPSAASPASSEVYSTNSPRSPYASHTETTRTTNRQAAMAQYHSQVSADPGRESGVWQDADGNYYVMQGDEGSVAPPSASGPLELIYHSHPTESDARWQGMNSQPSQAGGDFSVLQYQHGQGTAGQRQSSELHFPTYDEGGAHSGYGATGFVYDPTHPLPLQVETTLPGGRPSQQGYRSFADYEQRTGIGGSALTTAEAVETRMAADARLRQDMATAQQRIDTIVDSSQTRSPGLPGMREGREFGRQSVHADQAEDINRPEYGPAYTASVPGLQPGESLEIPINPAYPEPPGTMAELEALQEQVGIAQAAQTELTATENSMATQAEQQRVHSSELGEAQGVAQEIVTGRAAHQSTVDSTAGTNTEQQTTSSDAISSIGKSTEQKASLYTLVGSLRVFQGMAHLFSYLPGSLGNKAEGAKNDAGELITTLNRVNEAEGVQANIEGSQSEIMANEQRIESVSTAGEQTDVELTSGQDQLTSLEQANATSLAETESVQQQALHECTAASASENEAQTSHDNLLAQLESWSQEHRQVRENAIREATERFNNQGYQVREM